MNEVEAPGGKPTSRQRAVVLFSGRVQGVGFRYQACQVADGFDVAGYVENLPDGRVRLVAEADSPELARFIEAVRLRLARHIRDCDIQRVPPSGEFAGFFIRR